MGGGAACIHPGGPPGRVTPDWLDVTAALGQPSLRCRRIGTVRNTLVPDDPAHVMYVWLDALVNYITAVGYGAGRVRELRDEIAQRLAETGEDASHSRDVVRLVRSGHPGAIRMVRDAGRTPVAATAGSRRLAAGGCQTVLRKKS